MFDTIVIGAGQAGLAAGYHLQRAGVRFTLLEAGLQAGGSWPNYYDSLTLFSPARFSSLPGLPLPGDPERYPKRDEVASYLQQYAAHFNLPITTSAKVASVERGDAAFHLVTESGAHYQARSLVAATGSFHRPNLPQLPGQTEFRGTVIHSSAYRNPEPFRGQRVLVVGARNSAVQIGVELAQVAQTTLATREPLRFKPQRIHGQDIHFWWWLTGFDRVELASLPGKVVSQLSSSGVLDTGKYQAAIAAGRPDHRPMFQSFTRDGVIWADGREEAVDTVIFATGYKPNLDFLAPLGAIDDTGQACQQGGVSLTVPGLYYVGLQGQRSYQSATLRGVGSDAAHVVRHIAHFLHVPSAHQRLVFKWRYCC